MCVDDVDDELMVMKEKQSSTHCTELLEWAVVLLLLHKLSHAGLVAGLGGARARRHDAGSSRGASQVRFTA